MSVESEILRIQHNIANAYAAVSERGGEVPLQPTSANLAQAVASIPAGSSIIPGDGLSQDGDTINVDNPVRGIYTQAEFDALTDAQKASGTYFVQEPTVNWWSPIMTSNNAPAPYVATASSDWRNYGSSGPFAAFDNNQNTYWANNQNDDPPWIAIDFGEEEEIFGLKMWGRTAVAGQLPHTFTVQGSHNGTDWADIYSAEDLPPDEAGAMREFVFPAPATYRHYRITNMKSHYRLVPGSTVDTYIGIANIRFADKILGQIEINSNGKTLTIQGDGSDGGTAQEVYSTEEVRIGTWIDGKPLYRRVYSITLPSTSGIQTIISLPSDIDVQFLKARGYDNSVADTVFFTGTNYSDGTFDLWYKPLAHVIEGQIGSQLYKKQALVVLEYTKATDTATASLSPQSDGTIKLSNSALDLSSIPSAPVTAAEAGMEINKMEV